MWWETQECEEAFVCEALVERERGGGCDLFCVICEQPLLELALWRLPLDASPMATALIIATACSSWLLSAPSTPLLRAPPRSGVVFAVLEQPDELKSRFARDDGDNIKTAFVPDAASPAAQAAKAAKEEPSANAKLLAEIRALQPEPIAPAPEKKKIDLNGIYPRELLIGTISYGIFSTFAWKFTTSTADYFSANEVETSFYVVQRLSSIARVVLVSLGSLGTGITFFAAMGQLLLAIQVSIGISKGELDPTKERDDPWGANRKDQLSKLWGFMQGDAKAGTETKRGDDA